MARFGNPAASALAGNAVGMAALAGGVASVAFGLGAAFEAAADALVEVRYTQSLGAAFQHADEMTEIARASIAYTAELEAEVAQLRAACQQRQEVIELLKNRKH